MCIKLNVKAFESVLTAAEVQTQGKERFIFTFCFLITTYTNYLSSVSSECVCEDALGKQHPAANCAQTNTERIQNFIYTKRTQKYNHNISLSTYFSGSNSKVFLFQKVIWWKILIFNLNKLKQVCYF